MLVGLLPVIVIVVAPTRVQQGVPEHLVGRQEDVEAEHQYAENKQITHRNGQTLDSRQQLPLHFLIQVDIILKIVEERDEQHHDRRVEQTIRDDQPTKLTPGRNSKTRRGSRPARPTA